MRKKPLLPASVGGNGLRNILRYKWKKSIRKRPNGLPAHNGVRPLPQPENKRPSLRRQAALPHGADAVAKASENQTTLTQSSAVWFYSFTMNRRNACAQTFWRGYGCAKSLFQSRPSREAVRQKKPASVGRRTLLTLAQVLVVAALEVKLQPELPDA